MHKSIRLLLCLLLALGLTVSLFCPVFAAKQPEPEAEPVPERRLHISTARSFLNFAEKCRLDSYSRNLHVYIDKDLDLSGTDFQGIPIFEGILDGRNHTVSGLELETAGSHQGLIRFLSRGAEVRNLNVRGRIQPTGSQTCIGGIVGTNAGTVENCQFNGSITAKDSVGGIAGENTVTGILSGCHAQGEISAEHKIGGIAGENLGVVIDCKSHCQINTSSHDNIVQVTSITIDTLKGTEDPHTVTDAGGIAGVNSGVIRGCTNRGGVGYRHMGYNIGGIAGSQSGYIVDSTNYGTVFGRKEAGGIAGQFLPAAKIEYSEDTLQILEKQISGASSALNRASYNAQSNMGSVGEGIGALREQTQIAQDAIWQLLEGAGNADPDQILAAQNALGQSMHGMHTTMGYLGQAIQGTAGQLASDLRTVSARLSAMTQTLRNAKETTKATLNDVSDQDTPEDLTGKIAQCRNLGQVSGDINAGGIAGSIAFESGQDPEEDVRVEGSRSLNAEGELRAVILDCENKGTVSGKKLCAGGIVGHTTLGLIRGCVNTGTVLGEKAQYVGGIAGNSEGYIRSCHVKCKLSGESYVGGIAGSGTIVTDCLSMVLLEDTTERQGAILGVREASRDEKVTEPVKGNFYMSLTEDPGAIDSVSYQGVAEPMSPRVFISQEDLPQAFQKTVLTFRYEDGKEREVVLPAGSTLRTVQIPILPRKDGFTAHWENMEEYADQRVYFDAVFNPVYEPDRITIRSREARENGRPVLLAEGTFPKLDCIEMEPLAAPSVEKGQVLESWTLPDFSVASDTVLHYAMPGGADPEYLQVLLRGQDGQWRQVPFTVNASCLIFSAGSRDDGLALVELPDYSSWIYIIGGAALVIVLTALIRRRKRKKTKKPDKA